MYDRHEETIVEVSAPIERVFEAFDEHARMSSHMSRRSWRMGGGKMDVTYDSGRFQRVGSHLILSGRVFGLHLYVDEVVVKRELPATKVWETVGAPRLLIIGSYRMGFELQTRESRTQVRVFLDYAPPQTRTRVLGWLFGRVYARWCVRQMANQAAIMPEADSRINSATWGR